MANQGKYTIKVDDHTYRSLDTAAVGLNCSRSHLHKMIKREQANRGCQFTFKFRGQELLVEADGAPRGFLRRFKKGWESTDAEMPLEDRIRMAALTAGVSDYAMLVYLESHGYIEPNRVDRRRLLRRS